MRGKRLLATIVTIGATACVQPVGPARTFDDYEDKARDTAETTLGSVETVRLAIENADGLLPTYASVLLGDAEGDADGAQSTFEGIQPPGEESDRLRDQLTPILDDATALLAEARITARRADLGGLDAYAGPLHRVAGRLDRFIGEHGG